MLSVCFCFGRALHGWRRGWHSCKTKCIIGMLYQLWLRVMVLPKRSHNVKKRLLFGRLNVLRSIRPPRPPSCPEIAMAVSSRPSPRT